MISLSLTQLASELNARLVNLPSCSDLDIDTASTDSRTIEQATLFIALRGERFDGHDFSQVAADNGAVALLVERELPIPLPQLVVGDSLQAMGQMGALLRKVINPKCVALTGSNGKTTVKEMVATILNQQHQVLFTSGNFNNEVGVPLTLLRLSQGDEYGVFELGANHQGEIDNTSNLVRPDVALVNNVASAHLEGFGSQDGVAQAKSEIFTHLAKDGTAIINADDAYCQTMIQAASPRQTLLYSVSDDGASSSVADVTASDVIADEQGCYQFNLNHLAHKQSIHLPLVGQHQIANALAAASICIALGLSLGEISNGLAKLVPVKGRMVPKQLGRLLVVDDSYNANPASVSAAINWLEQINGKTCLVLGDLGELGENAAVLHRELGQQAKSQGIDALFCVGQLTQATSQGYGSEHSKDFESLVAHLIQHIKQTPESLTVLVKGSRSSAMERVVERLSAAFERGEFL